MPQLVTQNAKDLSPGLASFFERYLKCYEDFAPQRLGSFFAYPCLICDSNGDHFLHNECDIAEYGAPFVEGLRQAALRTITTEVLPGASTTGGGLFCSTRNKFCSEDGNLVGDMEYHYHLVDEDRGFRVKYASMGKIHYWM